MRFMPECYYSVLVTKYLKGIYKTRAGCGGYLLGEGVLLRNHYLYKSIYHLHQSDIYMKHPRWCNTQMYIDGHNRTQHTCCVRL